MNAPPSPRYGNPNQYSPQNSPRQIPRSAFLRSKSPAVTSTYSATSPTVGGVAPESWYTRARETNNAGRNNNSLGADHGDSHSLAAGSPLSGLAPSRGLGVGGKSLPPDPSSFPSPIHSTNSPIATAGHSPMPSTSPDIMSASGTRRDKNGSSVYTGSENGDDNRSMLDSSTYSPQIPPVSRAPSNKSKTQRQSIILTRIPPPKMYQDEASSASISQATHGTSDSDTMLMALLASQAAVDCQSFAVGGWEEVDLWKKELTLLTSRLVTVVARHQREQKILTAAKTLAKLNNNNKRMSKQSIDSLEVAEKKAADAEKEMLVLRDREQDLRRRLLEHWAGVMAWEVKRLGLIATQAEEKLAEASKNAEALEELDELAHQVEIQQTELKKKSNRIEEMEQMMKAMSAREFEMEKEMKEMDGEKRRWDEDKRRMDDERKAIERQVEEEKRKYDGERRAVERQLNEGLAHSRNWEAAKTGLKQALRRDDVDGLPQILEAVQKLESAGRRKDEELKVIKDEMREVGMGLEAELGRVAAERDGLKVKCEELGRAAADRDGYKAKSEELGKVVADRDGLRVRYEELTKSAETDLKSFEADMEIRNRQIFEYEAKLLRQADQLSALQDSNNKLQDHSSRFQDSNRKLQEALAAAEQSSAARSRDVASSSELEDKVRSMRAELEANDVLLEDLWTVLPSNEARGQSGLIDIATNRLHSKFSSPSSDVNFEGLRAMYEPQPSSSSQPFAGAAEAVKRVKVMLEDSRVLVERVINAAQERELLKNNASRAQKLVEESRGSLETYQHQVSILEARLKNAGSAEGAMLEQLNDLRANMEKISDAKRRLEADAAKQADICERLSQANDSLSAKALTMAEDAEQEKRGIQLKLEKEIDVLKIQLRNTEEDIDDMRTAEQTQRIQLLDELNSLQGEVQKLRSQLRAYQRGDTPPR